MANLSAEFSQFFSKLNYLSLVDLMFFVALSVVVFLFFRKRHSIRITIFIALFMLVYLVIYLLSIVFGGIALQISLKILDGVAIFLIVCVIVVYQSDFKVLFAKLARGGRGKNGEDVTSDEMLISSAHEMVTACQNMAKNDVGALIIIVKNSVPDRILDTGTELNAKVSSGLLESIFSTKGPLHDGAVVIKGDRILSAGCFLPLSKEVDIAKELGTRHRAAIGITEESDVFAIVVSEETGVISTSQAGKIVRYMTPERLLEEIKSAYNITSKPNNNKDKKKKDKKFI